MELSMMAKSFNRNYKNLLVFAKVHFMWNLATFISHSEFDCTSDENIHQPQAVDAWSHCSAMQHKVSNEDIH